ncbi:hypothetical protein CLG96_02960 [Sphingomonas oleivorans]|uniref:Uncharacterized protein n=1 Tax=Sphingomonas oleivorans TaxID=1735121 RepID=A0A2T5G1T1_9SPHN|nr:hypothetical protein [Sphingomonas oleivorans]PTQ13106.1 hypothetical protein CLG96_02960 [Sphingomonas oleivorans]
MGKDYSGSLELVARMLSGKLPGLPRRGFSIVDVRDLVDIHLKAMTPPEGAGQRFIAAGDAVDHRLRTKPDTRAAGLR